MIHMKPSTMALALMMLSSVLIPKVVKAITYCDGGIKNGNVCCASSCGACGGCDCAKSRGGANECCPGTIYDNGLQCMLSSDTGCIIGADDPNSSPPSRAARGRDGCYAAATESDASQKPTEKPAKAPAKTPRPTRSPTKAPKTSAPTQEETTFPPTMAFEPPTSRPTVPKDSVYEGDATMCVVPHPLTHKNPSEAVGNSEYDISVELESCITSKGTTCIEDEDVCTEGGYCVKVTVSERRTCGHGGDNNGLGALVGGAPGFIGVSCELEEVFKGDDRNPICVVDDVYSGFHFYTKCGTPSTDIDTKVNFKSLCPDPKVDFDAFCTFERRNGNANEAEAIQTNMRICFDSESHARQYLSKQELFGVRAQRTGDENGKSFKACANLCELS